MMLGYTLNDLDEMRAVVTKALYDSKGLPTEKGLEKTADFLDGLWSEGYFDQIITLPRIYKASFNQSYPGLR